MRIAESNAPAADNILKLIEKKGLKQVYVAEKAGYKAQELNDMLNGRRLIKVRDITRLALALDADINEIYAIGKETNEKDREEA